MIVVIVGGIACFLGCCFGFLLAAVLSSGSCDDAYRAGYRTAKRIYGGDIEGEFIPYGGTDD